jgi:hypothetical protein
MSERENRIEVAESRLAKLQHALGRTERILEVADRGQQTAERAVAALRVEPVVVAAVLVAAGLVVIAVRRAR